MAKSQGSFRDIPDAEPDPEQLGPAGALIDRRTSAFDAGAFHDRDVDALRDLAERKRKAKGEAKIIDDGAEGVPRASNVVRPLASPGYAQRWTPGQARGDGWWRGW